MDQCFTEFYSNDYQIIVIMQKNMGGQAGLCVPFTQYLQPKIFFNTYNAIKQSKLILENFPLEIFVINPDTCKPFSDDILDGTDDKYSEEVIHKRSKIFDFLRIDEKIEMEKKRKEYLSKKYKKKPTDIIIFTDGFSFSCASTFITGIQSYGSAIIVGYNPRPDLSKKYFDASQSSSYVNQFKSVEYVKNLENLGCSLRITYVESFDPNDKNTPNTPYEFSINPVDEIVKIYKDYNDTLYNRFISEAKSIFKKYNEDGECNPDNKYLYYETSDCDSKLNIDKAHGGYLCGTDGKWNKSNCIASYCDEGYILNKERTECITNPCDETESYFIEIEDIEKIKEITIGPKTVYSFNVTDKNNSYCILSNKEYLIHYFNLVNYSIIPVNNESLIKFNDTGCINYYLNNTENTTIIIVNKNYLQNYTSNSNSNSSTPTPSNSDSVSKFDYYNKKKGIATWKIILILIGLILALLIVTALTLILRNRSPRIKKNEIESEFKNYASTNNLK